MIKFFIFCFFLLLLEDQVSAEVHTKLLSPPQACDRVRYYPQNIFYLFVTTPSFSKIKLGLAPRCWIWVSSGAVQGSCYHIAAQ